jgi:hypothetical protein
MALYLVTSVSKTQLLILICQFRWKKVPSTRSLYTVNAGPNYIHKDSYYNLIVKHV